MADNPFARFAPQGTMVDTGGNPFARFAVEPTAPAQPAGHGIDFNQPKESVRAAIAALPQEQRRDVTKEWAQHYVANEKKGMSDGQKFLRGANDILETAARGTPVGSFGDEIDAWLKDKAYAVTGGGIGAPYDETVEYNRARHAQFDKENPKSSFGLKIGGAIASLPATPMLYVVKPISLGGRSLNAAATGTAYGAAYGAGEGTDGASRAQEAAKGGILGGILGAAAVPVAQGVSNTVKYAADKYRGMPAELAGMSRPAVDKMARGMEQEGFAAANGTPVSRSFQSEANALGREGTIADMGDNFTHMAKGIATQQGKGQKLLKDTMEARATSSAQRIADDTDAVLGQARNLVTAEREAVDTARREAAPLYEAFYSTPVKPSEALYGLLDRAKASGAYDKALKAMKEDGFDAAETFYKGMPNSGVNNAGLNGRFIDYIKRAVDDLAGAANRAGEAEATRRYSSLAKLIRDETDRILSPNNPAQSTWARARSASGDGFQFREGLEAGADAFKKGTHPDQFRADLGSMSPIERSANQMGARGYVRDIMGNASAANSEASIAASTGARKALGSDYARQKLEMITDGATMPGRAAPEQLIRRLDAETKFAQTRQAVYGGSQTAANLDAQKAFPSSAARSEWASEAGKKGPMGLLVEFGAKVANAATAGHLNARQEAIARDAARMLSAQGLQRDQIARALISYAERKGMTKQGRDALSRVISETIGSQRSPLISETVDRKSVTPR